MRTWLTQRLSALFDNMLWALVLCVAAAAGVSLIAFGGQRTDLPLWTVVLLTAGLVACVVSVVVLFRRLRALAAIVHGLHADRIVTPQPPLPHPRAGLLRRIDALSNEAGKREAEYPAEWPAASAFNGILRDAQQETGSPLLSEIDELRRGEGTGWDSLAHTATYGTITTLLAQIRAIVE